MTNKQARLIQSAKEHIRNVFDNGIRFQWDHQFICNGANDCIPWGKVPNYSIEYLRGYRDCLMDLIWHKYVVFTYEIQGKRLAIDSDEYRQARKIVGYNGDTSTGQWSWRSNIAKPFSASSQEATSAPALNGELITQ